MFCKQMNPSPFLTCFNSTTTTTTKRHSTVATPPPPPHVSDNRNLTTCFYHTDLGLFALTWSRQSFDHSLLLQLLSKNISSATTAAKCSLPAFDLRIKPYIFWNKHGSKKFNITTTTTTTTTIQIFWDLKSAKFGSGPEPLSGFYIAVVVDGEMALLVGDCRDKAYSKTRAAKPERTTQAMILKREHVNGNKIYTTRASFGGKTRDISIDCRAGDDSKLCFSVDDKRVLEINHLKWNFRGSAKLEVDGVQMHVSWDLYKWLFKDGSALFMFKFEKLGFEDEITTHVSDEKNGVLLLSQELCGVGFEMKKKKKKSNLRTAKIISALSSESSACSSVMKWESVEENELKGPSQFSLMVYA